MEINETTNKLLETLNERAKELNCLYKVEECLADYSQELSVVFKRIIEDIPPGFQYSDFCNARINYFDQTWQSSDFIETGWSLEAQILVQDTPMGSIEVAYTHEMPQEDVGPFLNDEVKLLNTIAQRLSDFIQHQTLQQVLLQVKRDDPENQNKQAPEWKIVLNLARRMDLDLYARIVRKMLNYLVWHGVDEANEYLLMLGPDKLTDSGDGGNQPQESREPVDIISISDNIFSVADRNLSNAEILSYIEKWMQEDRASFLLKTLVSLDSFLGDVADSLRRYVSLSSEKIELSDSTLKGTRVALIRRFITEQLDFIKIAKHFVEIEDFHELVQRMIYPVRSNGQLGGKSAGLFLASLILKKEKAHNDKLNGIKVPKTWYITSDGLHNFMRNNNLEEVTEQKYKELGLVRQEYPHIIQLFKNSYFTPEITQGLSMALDDFGEKPLIVRSSSLLEDRFGAAFSGKYKSLFLANQGSKPKRLRALQDAIAEVYSSTFGPDPIEYRLEKELIDYKEEMGILVQEVVGTKVGKYFLPAYAGVAFSHNEFRWSPRIKREDGLIRLVPGLGTRAVDRLSNDFPVLIAPGQPGLRVNVSTDEVLRYAPKYIDVINLRENSFETIEIADFLKDYGDQLPAIMQMVSVVKDKTLTKPSWTNLNFEQDEVVVTFEGLIANSDFVPKMNAILNILQDRMGTPVDVEFANDGENFYLLQCRPQSFTPDVAPALIPKDIPENAILFTANRHISNGLVPDLTHIVYVDPQRYNELDDITKLRSVGRAVSKLNKLLPKRQFALMGPGRWGSRGDIKLGVNVTYSDINNTGILIEIARKKGNYVPDLSFGTHFFQDLVESSIRYLPLYPDENSNIFNESFLRENHNMFYELVPEYSHLTDVIRVLDIPSITGGKVLRIFMNAELEEAVGLLSQPASVQESSAGKRTYGQSTQTDDHWRWRSRMAERIAAQLDPVKFGVHRFFIFGSTKNATAGPGSDIDILIHFRGEDDQKQALINWLDGWSASLDEMNYLRTGYRSGGLLDVHIVTDEDISSRDSYAVKIGAVTDAARELPLKRG